jgi:hypothetical protein
MFTQTLKTCKRISGDLDRTNIAANILQHDSDDTHKFKNTGRNKKNLMNSSSPLTMQPILCSLRFPLIWSSKRRHVGKRFGGMAKLMKK